MPIDTGTILITGDEGAGILTELVTMLQREYPVTAAASPEAVRDALGDSPPDLIVVAARTSGAGGEVLRRMRGQPSRLAIPVLFVTAPGSEEGEALAAGAVDCLTTPLLASMVQARIETQLEVSRLRRRLTNEGERVEKDLLRRLSEGQLVTNLSVRALACLAEVRDNATGNHVLRTQAYVEVLGRSLARQPRFRDALTPERLDLIVRAAPLHDVGKVGLPDSIVAKVGRLTSEEFEVMKTHTTIGSNAIRKAMDQTLQGKDGKWTYRPPQAFGLLTTAAEIALSHHENWDGGGYPAGLQGEAIPVSARLMAVADMCDALQHARSYRPALDWDQTTRIMKEERDRRFDPDVLEAFLACGSEFAEVQRRYED
jgi:putative two-component system response regulator